MNAPLNIFFPILSLFIKYNFHRCKPVDTPLAAFEVRQWNHDDVILTSEFVYRPNMSKRIYRVFKLYATVSNCHFLRSATFFDNLKLLIVSFSQLVELLFECDVTDAISYKYYAPPS